MKIAFFSSVLNHHQIEFCDNMYAICGNGFVFVSTMDIEQQRIDLGYKLYERPYNLHMYISEENRKKAEQVFMQADIVILGVFLEEWLQKRLKQKKITFLYKERLFKKKASLYWRLRCQLFVLREYIPYRNQKFYMLAASAYSHVDFNSLGAFKNKSFAWGYFPPVKQYENIDELIELKHPASILWGGRLIEWKHPDYAVRVAEELVKKGIVFEMNIIGTGELENKLRQMVTEKNLTNYVNLLGPMSPDKVRAYMEKSSVFLFTSDRQEGWGAVLNEAMNSGCAVIASESAGSTNILIQNGVNGLIYKDDSYLEFSANVFKVISNKQFADTLGHNAYNTITSKFTAKIASQRLYDVARAIFNDTEVPHYPDGPMKLME